MLIQSSQTNSLRYKFRPLRKIVRQTGTRKISGDDVMRTTQKLLAALSLPLLLLLTSGVVMAQGEPMGKMLGKFIIFGDVDVKGAPDGKPITLTVELVLYRGAILQRQTVGSRGRYQFINVDQGDYDIVVEFENTEIYRDRVKLTGMESRFRRDISLEWAKGAAATGTPKPPTISAEDAYERKGPNKSRFEKAEDALNKKEYDKAV